MRLKLILGLLLGCGAAFAQCTGVDKCVQQTSATAANGGAGVTATWGTNLTAGNSVVVEIAFSQGNINSVVLVGGGAESLTADITNAAPTLRRTAIWHVHNIAGGSTGVKVTNSGANRTSFNAEEFTGLTNAGAEATNPASGTADPNPNTGSVTPVSANNIIVAVGAWTANDYQSGPTNSFQRLTQAAGGSPFQESAYLQQSSAATNSTAWVLTVGINWGTAIAVFCAPSTGPTAAQSSAGFWVVP